MLIKQGQLKIKTINGKIVAKPDLKSAAGNGVVRKYKVGEKGIRYRKIYKTKESRYMYLLEDLVIFNDRKTIEKKGKLDKTDAAISGVTTGLGSGTGTGWLLGEYLGRKSKNKHKYGVTGAIASTLGLGALGAYQNVRRQKMSNSSSMVDTAEFADKQKSTKRIKKVAPYKRNGRLVSGYIVDSQTGKKRYLTPAEMHYEKNQRAKEELEYRMRRLDQAKAREERLQREDKRRPVDDVRKNVSTAVNVSREAKGWLNTGNKIFGWFR